MKKRIWNKVVSIFTAILLVVGIVPNTTVTALAAGEDAPNTLYVGNQQVIRSSSTTYWTTDNSGGLTWVENATDDSNDWTVRYNPNTATLTLKDAKISGSYNEYDNPFTAGIYATGNSNQPVALTIELIGENTITGNYGIFLNAEISASRYGTNATLTITGENNGSLGVSGSDHGIYIKSGSGDASLNIKNVAVTSSTNGNYAAGVYVMSSANATGSPNISLSVNGGSLTASGGESSDGIWFYVGSSQASNATTSLTVSENAIVDAKTGGIKASDPNLNNLSDRIVVGSGTGTNGGIVFDGTEGTVYGDVTLDESLTINQGETLTIPEGSTLNTNNNLTNNGTIVNTGGTLSGEPGGIIVTAPAITTESLPEGTVNQLYSATLEVTGNNITWSLDSGTLPDGLTLDSNGTIAGTPTAAGTSTFTVTATNDAGSASKEYTLTIKAVSVTSLKLNKDSLTLQERGSDTLTATVEPADATNQDVIWKSSDTSIATVSADGTVTAISAGTATITATAKDGSGVSASCTLTVTHGKMVQTPKKDATCTVDGTEEYWTCEICGKHFEDESGTIPTTPEENKIQATGHSYGEPVWNWSEDGKTCTVTFTCKKDETHKETPKVKITSAVKTPATCTEAGVTTYTATVEFNGKTHTDTKDVADIPAIGHKLTKTEAKAPTNTDTGNIEYWYCEVCNKYFSDEKAEHEITLEDTIIAKLPKFVSGANQEWTKGSKDGLTFKIDTDIKEFKKVLVDGKELKDTDYDIKSGSTILTLKPSFLDTLSAGKHKIRFEFNTGSVEAYFTVKDKENSSQTESANTGVQNKYGLWIVLLLVAAGGLAGFGILSKRRKNHK
ncbi:Ig-like domain-containing protein [Faecalitalea cylindroides]|uniref:Ig-like domain-containing protein n=1 Tax=Faecalitalea cylindroides TaxID=39483 RepID=UPI002E7A8637|nr:Ig-like domain-containing protein [Faecalitalea cylindroides]MEE1449066.1 Ig-like domain-containing protein [Faecalitalea cylindroides]